MPQLYTVGLSACQVFQPKRLSHIDDRLELYFHTRQYTGKLQSIQPHIISEN